MPHDVPAGGNVPANEVLPAAKGKEEFAARLRELRVQAGSPPFRRLAKITNYSSSTLADATSGRRLPTEPVVAALVSACGADPAQWLEELRRISAAERSVRLADPSDPVALPGPSGRAAGRWRLALFTGLGALATLAAGFAAGRATSPASAAPPRGALELPGVPPFSGTPVPVPTARVADGTDPRAGHCETGAHLVASTPVIRNGEQIGLLQLMFSPWCGAGWARIYLSPGEPTMMGEVTIRSGDDRFSSFAYPLVNQVDDYTDVIVPGPGGCLGAGGAIYETGEPTVTAAIPCQAPEAG